MSAAPFTPKPPRPAPKRVLFELDLSSDPKRKTVMFRRSDMDDADNREKLLLLIKTVLFLQPPEFPHPTPSELEDALASVSWEYIAYSVEELEPQDGRPRLGTTLARAAREPGVNSGRNPVINDIELQFRH